LVPQPGYLTAEVDVKNQMLSEPQASFIWFRLAKPFVRSARDTAHKSCFGSFFSLSKKERKQSPIARSKEQYKIKERFEETVSNTVSYYFTTLYRIHVTKIVFKSLNTILLQKENLYRKAHRQHIRFCRQKTFSSFPYCLVNNKI